MLSRRLLINEWGLFSKVIRDWCELKHNCPMFDLRVSINALQVEMTKSTQLAK